MNNERRQTLCLPLIAIAAISTESNPQDLKVLNHLVLSSMKGDVNKNVLMPNRMSVSSLMTNLPFGKALFNHQGGSCAKGFLASFSVNQGVPSLRQLFRDKPDNISLRAAI